MSTTFAGLDSTVFTLAAIIGSMLLALGAALTWGVFHIRADRLPAATRHEDIRERLALQQFKLSEVQARIRELEQREHERDRLAVEVEVLERRLSELKLELENLAAAREDIRRVKDEAASAAVEKAELEQQLRTLRDEAELIRSEIDPERIAQLRRSKEESERELDRIRSELEPLRAEMDSALRSIGEARSIEARIEALRFEAEELRDEIVRLKSELAPCAREVADARTERDEVRRARDEAQENLEEVERQRTKLLAEVASLEVLRGGGGGGGQPLAKLRKDILADLVVMPVCLSAPSQIRNARAGEADALHEVANYLHDCGLSFSRRTLRAFHTALKINDTAQLTVLAGVSGTGKSLLPRRYAEAMGIHFLQVAVEPRWDSPQDLLGFYNYVEQKYRATELARLLAHLDPWRSLEIYADSPDQREHMALVLLDEMNLARVEYYFSEFLSRLEARPTWRNGLTPETSKDAMIPVDIRGLKDPPMLFPAHNVLFVGTMNDDESTQSLSDKVLDRGNVLQFPAPDEFPSPSQRQGTPAERAQSFLEWRRWVRPAGTLSDAAGALTRDTIGELAEVMQGFGRPFGHRLNQAIRAYVANYPHVGNAGLDARVPLADQIEFRILPKLRGIEIQPNRDRFEKLERIIRNDLDDATLAQRLSETCSDQERSSGLFVWRGLARGD